MLTNCGVIVTIYKFCTLIQHPILSPPSRPSKCHYPPIITYFLAYLLTHVPTTPTATDTHILLLLILLLLPILLPVAVELQGEGVQLTPRSEAGGQGYTCDPPPMMCCCCFCSALRSTFYYLERIKMQDFDQKFSNIFRGCYQRTPVVGGEHPLPRSPRPRHAF